MLRRAAAPGDPARVINVGSADGVKVPAGRSFSYTASKAGLHHLTRHLARTLAPEILVNCIAPGPFETAMLAPVLERQAHEFPGATLLGRTGQSHEIGGTAVFLASRASGYITGSVLAVDGGLLTKWGTGVSARLAAVAETQALLHQAGVSSEGGEIGSRAKAELLLDAGPVGFHGTD